MSETDAWRHGMVSIQTEAAVAVLTLDRPEKLNAMDRGFWDDLRAALDWATGREGVRCLVLRGAGERAFSAGGDVASFVELRTDEARRGFQEEAMAAFEAVATSLLPTIAAVRGYAFGGGCELAMACDMVIAAEDAQFGLPEARFGLVPGYGVLRAPILAGPQLAKLMIFAGERLTADDALRHGLVQKIVPSPMLMAEVMRIAGAVAKVPPTAIATAKALIHSALDPELVRGSVDAVTRLHATEESRLAVRRFMESQS